MKQHFNLFCRAALSCAAIAAVSQPLTYAKSEEIAEPRAAQSAIAKVEPIRGEINKEADYYIYLGSSSTCPPCRALMPKVVKEYSKMKRKNVELILVGSDRTEEAAIKYAEDYKVKFPAVHYMQAGALLGRVQATSLPNVTIVDADGKALASGGGDVILNWKKTIATAERDAKKAAAKEKREAAKAAKAAKEDQA